MSPSEEAFAMGQAKRKQQRECPAKGTTITPEECGRGRNSAIPCPVDCGFNPFALENYESAFGSLEAKVIQLLSRKLISDLSPSELRELAEVMKADDIYVSHALHAWHIYGAGRLEKWKAEGFSKDWKNDERVMLDCFTTMRVALLEFREVIDQATCSAVDLLHPDSPLMLIIDEGVAGHVGRFDVVLTWVYEVPAGHRTSGSSVALPSVASMDPVETFQHILKQLDAPGEGLDSWLMEHMALLADAFFAVVHAQQEQRVRISDLRRFELSYPLTEDQSEVVISRLETDTRVVKERPTGGSDAWYGALLTEGKSRETDPEAEVLGQVIVHRDRLEFESIGEENAEAGRRFLRSFSTFMGAEETTISDLELPNEGRSHDPDLVPAAILEAVDPVDLRTTIQLPQPVGRVPSEFTNHFQDFADKPIKMLGDKTPRDAAEDPVLRPALVRLMKANVSTCDRERRTKGEDVDLNPLLEELGLDELILPPPPLGFVDSPEDDDFDLIPPPLQPQLEEDEIKARMDRITKDEAHWNRLEIRLADILDALNDLPENFNAYELEILMTTTVVALGTLHPDQVPGYDPDPDRMILRYEESMKSGTSGEMLNDYLDRIFEETRQPILCEIAADFLVGIDREGGKKLREKKFEGLLTALASAIWEAAHWPPVLK